MAIITAEELSQVRATVASVLTCLQPLVLRYPGPAAVQCREAGSNNDFYVTFTMTDGRRDAALSLTEHDLLTVPQDVIVLRLARELSRALVWGQMGIQRE